MVTGRGMGSDKTTTNVGVNYSQKPHPLEDFTSKHFTVDLLAIFVIVVLQTCVWNILCKPSGKNQKTVFPTPMLPDMIAT